MTDKQPFIDYRQQRMDGFGFFLGHTHIKRAGKQKRLNIRVPLNEHAVVAPVPGYFNGDIPIARTFIQPVVAGRDLLDHIERIRR